jgi:hypothetical protein
MLRAPILTGFHHDGFGRFFLDGRRDKVQRSA